MVSLPELLELPKKQRLNIAERLWSSVAEEDDFAVPAAHKKIVNDRLAAYRNGELEPIPHNEFMRRHFPEYAKR